jgi:hypothetical protein
MNYNLTGISYILALTATLASPSPVAQTMGEEWEYQGNMQMMGMSMPVPLVKVCQEVEQEMTPPVDGNCEVHDFQTQGNTTTFKMRCGPPELMEGSGMTTRTDDLIDMKYTMRSEAGEMTFNMTGRKLGSCTL